MKCIKYLALLSFLIISGINNSLAQQQDPYKKFLDSLLRVLPLQKEDSSKALILINITRMKLGAAQNTGRWDEAIEWAQKSLQLSTKTNYQFGIGRANINLGQCWMQKGNYAEAIKYFYAALNLSLKNGRKVLTAASSNHLARCYSLLGNYDEALKHSLIGYEILQQLNNNGPIDEQQQATEIAQLYAKMHRFEEALRWYQKAIPENPGLFYEGDIILGIASIQMEMKNYPEALKNYRAAVQIYPKRFKRIPEMETAGVSGTWYEQLGEAYFKIGTLTEGSERIAAFNEAINYLNKSLPLLKEGTGGKETLMNAYNLLKQTCEAINDYQGALYYSNLYAALKDSIYNKTTYLKLADQKVKFETEKAASEMNAKQELEKALNEKLLADQKLEQEKMLADERIASEKVLAEQKMEQEKAIAIAREKGNYEKSIAVEKVKKLAGKFIEHDTVRIDAKHKKRKIFVYFQCKCLFKVHRGFIGKVAN